MVNYKCIRCGYTTNDKSKIKSHFNRKTVCKPKLNNINLDQYKEKILNGEEIILENDIHKKSTNYLHHIHKKSTLYPQKIHNLSTFNNIEEDNWNCEFCKKELSSYKSLWRHLRNCKEKKKDDEERDNLLNLVNMLNEQLKQKDQQLNEQMKELNKRNNQIDELIKKTGINIGTQNIQQNIKILAYKNTDLSHLTDQDYLQCLNRSNMVIPNLIKRIHFDPKKPENHNIYISNIRNKYVMVYDGNKWNVSNQNETIEELIDKNEIVIEQKLEEWVENGREYPEIMKKFNRYLEKKEKDEVINKIKEEIKLILFNNRKVIEAK